MIHRNFDNISKPFLVEQIQVLRNRIGKSRYNIKISCGIITHLDHDSRVIIDNSRYSSNQSMTSLKMEDLIIMLRYLQNLQKCREIVMNESEFGEVYDLKKKRWKIYPTNPHVIQNKIKDYLKVKKNVATVGNRVPKNPKEVWPSIKENLLKLKEDFKNNITSLYYDTRENSFLIIIDNDKNAFYNEVLKFSDDVKKKYKIDCKVLPFLEYIRNVRENKMDRLITY
jgi:hypothetical protein